MFCYKDSLYGIDAEGRLWKHDYDSNSKAFSNVPVQIGEGWGSFTHIVPFASTLLCRDIEGKMYRYAFDPENYWDLNE